MQTIKKIFGGKMLLFVFMLISSAAAQKVELIYTAAGVNQALAYKDEMKLKEAAATNALSLMNISDERKNAYLKNLSGTTAVVIFGDGGVKAVKTIDYNIPVIIVNSLESTAAKSSVIRVLDKDFKGSAPSAKSIDDPGSLAKADIAGKDVAVKCTDGAAAVKKIISLLK